jgi:hypothetical protein
MAEREGEMCEGNRGEWVMIHTVYADRNYRWGGGCKKGREVIEGRVK